MDTPCKDCLKLIGAPSAENPHGGLSLMKYRRALDAQPLAHVAAFYRCSLCNCLLVRDPPRLGNHAKWDLI